MSTRTTLTLDDDIAVQLKKQARTSGRSFKQVVNETLRRGLHRSEPSEIPPFRMKTYDMKPKPGIDFDDIGGLLEQVEGDWHR